MASVVIFNGLTKQPLKRAEAAGLKALVITVDNPEIGFRLANKKNNFSLPSHLSMGHSETAQSSFKAGSVDLEEYVKVLINPIELPGSQLTGCVA